MNNRDGKDGVRADHEDLKGVLRSLLMAIDEDTPFEQAGEAVLDRLTVDPEQGGECLAWLIAYDLDPLVANMAFTSAFMALKGGALDDETVEILHASMGPLLHQALKAPGISDERKYKIGPLCAICLGPHILGPDYEGHFEDFEGVRQRLADQTSLSLSVHPREVEEILENIAMLIEEDMPLDSRYASVANMAYEALQSQPAAAIMLFSANLLTECIDEPNSEVDIDEALASIASAESPEAAWCLDQLGRWPGLPNLAPKAERAGRKLSFRGHQASYPFKPNFARAMLSITDGMGSRQLTLLSDSGGEDLDAVNLLLNDRVGIKDAWVGYDKGTEIEEQILGATGNITYAPCSLHFAREILGDVWALHEQLDIPLNPRLLLYLPYFGPEPITRQRRVPSLQAYKLENLQVEPALVAGSQTLAQGEPYGLFAFTGEAAYAFVALLNLEQAGKTPKHAVDGFLKAVEDEERDTLVSRMIATLEVEAMAKHHRQMPNKRAAAVCWALLHDDIDFASVPYVRETALVSLDMIAANISMGFASQAQADKAAMAMDDEMNDFFNGLFDDD